MASSNDTSRRGNSTGENGRTVADVDEMTGSEMPPDPETVVVSGIQPSGRLHLGNYFGAIRQHLNLHETHDAFYFIVNYHAMTTVRDADRLRDHTFDVALDYLALGFDPEEAALFVQSDVPEVTELMWILFNLLPTSRLERGVAYKEKVEAGLTPNAGLFNYPVLQAADILAYGGSLVPVGADQKQNLEIARDVARRFNQTFFPEDETLFPIPEAHILDDVAVVPGTDGRKMSKSYDNTIDIFDEGEELKEKVMSIVTDSTPLNAPKDPETCNIFALIKLFADEETQREIAEKYRAGGYGYGHAKKELLGLIEEHFAEARTRRKELEQRPDYVRDVLREGAKGGPGADGSYHGRGALTGRNSRDRRLEAPFGRELTVELRF
jgi:tryptophanyl-tRNA synthetase